MIITEEMIKVIKELNAYMKSENGNVNNFATLLKNKSEELGIDYNVLLNLTLNRNFLFQNVYNQVNDLEKEITIKERELNELRKRKYILGSLVCDLHGHNYDWEAFDDMQICTNCGEKKHIVGSDANKHLEKTKMLTSSLYKKEDK